MSERTLKGRMVISRYSGNNDGILIKIQDESSRVGFLTIDVSFESFAKILTSFEQEIEYEVRGLDKLGKTLETKTEYIEYNRWDDDEGEYAEKIKEFEVDGWQSDESQPYKNIHRRSNGKVAQRFVRWV